ncbi:MAG: hypothetical protein QF432_07185, partial [Dehalococcoidales bacterium]|nr:hypothetical protein [Dehalococcoidales bacterium]
MVKRFIGTNMGIHRYSEWDGTQDLFDLTADGLMDELGQSLLSSGDLADALRRMQNGGLKDSQGRRLPSIQQLLQRLRQAKQDHLDKYDLGSMLDDITEKLDQVLETERSGIERKLDEARQKVEEDDGELSAEIRQRLLKNVQNRAAQNRARLDELPPDTGGRIKELTDYDFVDEDARNQFKELMDMLKKQAMESYGRDLLQKVKDMDPDSLANMRHMVEALNQMLEQRMRGEEPDFAAFMEQFGDYFGDNPPRDLDELMETLQSQIAQAQSLMDSLSGEDRESLGDLLKSMLDDS